MSWAETKTIWDRIESARSSLASTLSGIATNASTAASKAAAAATDAATAATKATAAATDAAAAKTNAANAQLSSTRLGYIDRIANGTYGLDKIQALVATNNTASTTGILSQKLSSIIGSLSTIINGAQIMKASDNVRITAIGSEIMASYSQTIKVFYFYANKTGKIRLKASGKNSGTSSSAKTTFYLQKPGDGYAEAIDLSFTGTTYTTKYIDIDITQTGYYYITAKTSSASYTYYLNNVTICYDLSYSSTGVFDWISTHDNE